MIGYYFRDTKGRERLYVPFNMLVTKDKSIVSVDFNPNIISKPGRFIELSRTSLQRGLIARVEIFDPQLDYVRNFCFSQDISHAENMGKEVFDYVRRNWRKIKI